MKTKNKSNWLIVSVIGNVLAVIILVCLFWNSYTGASGSKYADAAYEESAAAWAGVEEVETEEEMPAEGYSNAKSTEEDVADIDVDAEAVRNGEKLVYTANIFLETKDYKAHKARIYEIVQAHGGVIESSSEENYDTVTHGYWTLRIPYDQYQAAYQELCSADAGWMVRQASSRVENMTKQYSKLTSQIEAYEQERETLLELLKNAENVSETLEIQDRLAWLNSDLQWYYNQREDIDTDVQMSTIYLDLQEIKERQQSRQPYTFSERIRYAFENGKDAFLSFCAGFVLFFVRNWLFIGLLIVLGLILLGIVRSTKKRRQKKAAAKPAEEIEETKEESIE